MSEDSVRTTSTEATTAQPATRQPFVERLSDALQGAVGTIIGSKRRPPRRLKSLLNGTWLGHPLHPVITDVPIASWLLAALFDIIWLVSPTGNAWAARAAEVAVLAGIVAALGAAVTGLTDWSDTYGHERRVGLLHGLLNVLATVLYAVSLGLRLAQPSGEVVAAAIIGFVGLVVVSVAAYFGGELVFTIGTGVNHTAWEAASEDYAPALPLAEIPADRLVRVTVAGVPVAVGRVQGDVYAVAATCPHAGGPLDEGAFADGVVECPWHGSRFCLRDGRVLTGPATVDAPRYLVRIRDGMVELKRAAGH